MPLSVFSLLIYYLLLSSKVNGERETAHKLQTLRFSIGAIVDLSTRIGKEEQIAMNLAADDYQDYTKHIVDLHIEDSGKDPTQMAYIGMDLIKQKKVGAIMGLRKRDEAKCIADLGAKSRVPVLSLADPLRLNPKRWPFLIQAAQSQYHQMEAVADIIKTWEWRNVNIIYEDSTFTVIQNLLEILRAAGIYVEHLLALEPLSSSLMIKEELEKVRRDQSRVFIVHASLPLARELFIEAKKMRLMEMDSVWITTTAITDLLHSFDVSDIALMEGIIGIKTYFPQTEESFKHFKPKFQRRFLLAYPKEARSEPGIYALQAYDALWSVAMAIGRGTTESSINASVEQWATIAPILQKKIFHKISQSKFKGLTGDFHLKENKLGSSKKFQIVNVLQRRYRELGYWSKGRGFSRHPNEGERYRRSMKILGELLWPGGSSKNIPRGWALPTSGRPLIIALPGNATFKQYVDIKFDKRTGTPILDGFSGEVFDAVRQKMPYPFSYEFEVYHDSYDNMVKEIYHKRFDAAVGDTTILAERCNYTEFSQPWMDSGIQMVVLKKPTNRAWLFLMPFNIGLWVLTTSISIYNGFVIWLMERKHYQEYNGSALNKAGALTWLAFATLFSRQGETLHSNLTRMTMLVWLFVSLIIIQSYTASLTSMLTIPLMDSSDITVEFLKNSTDAKVGCDGVSFVNKYLQEVLGLHEENIKKYNSSTEYPQALEKGEIKAAFMEVPYIKIFMAINCKRFKVVGPVYRVGGFGFAFRKGSPMLPDISKAILDVTESGKMLNLEKTIIDSSTCLDSDDDKGKLGVSSFWGLFLISGATSTVALLIYLLGVFKKRCRPLTHHGQHDPNTDETVMFASEMREHHSTGGLRYVRVQSDHNNSYIHS